MGTGEFSTEGNPTIDWHPIQGGVEIFIVTLYYRNRSKLQLGEPLGSYSALFILPVYDLAKMTERQYEINLARTGN